MIFTLIHLSYMNIIGIVLLCSNNTKILSLMLLILLSNYLSIFYFKDCILTLLEKKSAKYSLIDIAIYIYPNYKDDINQSSTIALTLVLSIISLLFLKIIILLFFPIIIKNINNF